jgi:hypothetical protein
VVNKELRRFLSQFEKALCGRRTSLDPNIGENAIKVGLRPGTDPGIHLPFAQPLSQLFAAAANPLPNGCGKREVLAFNAFVDQSIKLAWVRRFVSSQD